MKKFYYIDGWRYGEQYFRSVGHFTEQEWERIQAGEIVSKRGFEFYIIEYEE